MSAVLPLNRSLPARLDLADRIGVTLTASALLHLLLLFGVNIAVPEFKEWRDRGENLEVVLVNSKSAIAPPDTKLLAQSNLEGGGNTDEDRRAKSPLPVSQESAQEREAAEERVAQLEEEARQVMTQLNSPRTITPEARITPTPSVTPGTGTDSIVARSLEMASLAASIDRNTDEYQKRPRRKFIGARTKEYRFARYVEDWRAKVERWGNLNYPEMARQQRIYGQLQMTVSINADGSLENVEIDRSSGHKVLDDAALKIVRDAGRNGFSPLPADIRADTDVLHITRTWTFTREDQLQSN